MRGEIETRLERGIEAAQAGEAKRAREILVQVIQLDQYNEQAWLWLSSVVESTGDKRVCLENVLFINPDNTHAAAGLQRLRQQLTDYLTSSPTLPSLAVSRAMDVREEEEEEEGGWEWAGRVEREGERKWEWDASATATAPTPTGKMCSRCGYRNPSWIYVCDRCGADLQPVDLHEALSSGAKPRGRSPFTLLAAWGGAFAFSRFFAYLPEIELVSWGRSLAALAIAALFVSAWRAVVAVVPQLRAGGGEAGQEIVVAALRCTVETLPPALLLTLVCVPIVLLTWVGARLAGGKQGLKTHAHLTVVAFSAWLILMALLAPLLTSTPSPRGGRLDLLFERVPALVGRAAGLIGVVWLMQALRTAHHLSVGRTVLAMLVAIALSVALLFGLNLLVGEWLAGFVNTLTTPFLPWSG